MNDGSNNPLEQMTSYPPHQTGIFMKITIKCYRNEKTIFEGEYESTKHALIDAVSKGAHLQGAYLRGADLRGAYLQGAHLQGEKLKICPILMQLERWDVIITHGFMQIGCERHTHTEWNEFNRLTISKMAAGAWNWWKEHKDMLMLACDIQVKQSAKIKDELDTKEEGK